MLQVHAPKMRTSVRTGSPALLAVCGLIGLVVLWLTISSSAPSTAVSGSIPTTGRLLAAARVSPEVAAQRLADHVEQLGKLLWLRSKIDRNDAGKRIDPNLPGVYSSVTWVWDVAKPTIQCSTLSRVGKFGDGGKWMCDLQWLPEPCVVYAYGVWGDVSWDRDLRKQTGCEMHLFDASPSWCGGKDGKVRQQHPQRVRVCWW